MTDSASPHNLWTTAKDLYMGLSFPVRMLMIVFLAMLSVLLGCLQLMQHTTEMAYLMGGQELKLSQIQAISRTLDAEGLAGYQVDGLRIKVPREQIQQYAAAIAKQEVVTSGLYAPFDRAAEQATWLSSGIQDDRRWELAKQKSLAQSIELMPEVESASVLIDRATPRGIRQTAEVRATVTVKPRAGQELPPFRVRQIRTLVVGAVANLAPENVAVVDLNGRTLLELGANGTNSDDLLMRMKEFEEHYAWKIRSVLAYLPDVMVTVSVELETIRQRRTEHVLQPPHEDSGHVDADRNGSDSKPRVTANSATELQPVEETASPEPPPMQQTWEEHVALAPKSLTVSVAVPQDAVASTPYGQPNGNVESGVWSEPIRQRVASALPAGVTASITVTSYPRRVDQMPATASRAQPAKDWKSWASVATTCIALAPLGVWAIIRWHRARVRHDRMSAMRSRPDARSSFEGRSGAGRGQAARRELVRVERDTSREGRGPHLMQASICAFEDLRWLAPASLQAVLGAVDSRLWAPALRGASRQLCDRVLTHMPARAAALLRDEIEFPGPVRLGDVETAQQEILEIVRRLDHTGDLVLEDREEILHE